MMVDRAKMCWEAAASGWLKMHATTKKETICMTNTIPWAKNPPTLLSITGPTTSEKNSSVAEQRMIGFQ